MMCLIILPQSGSSMYKIKIEYTTGDSFKTYKAEGWVEFEWSSLEVVTANLSRIKEHYNWYQFHTCGKFQQSLYATPMERPAFTHPKYDESLLLMMEDGAERYYGTFWCGYFETLHRIVIEEAKPTLPEYTF